MNIKLKNARILSLVPGETLYEGEVHVLDGVIAHAGKEIKIGTRFDREIDCRGGVLLPGFKNAHAHAAMTFLRSYADDLPLHDWLYEQVFPMEAKLTPDDVYWLTRLAILEYVSGGTTAAFDMYYYRDAVAAASIDSGFRMTIMSGVNDFGGSAEQIESEYGKFNSLDPLINYRIGAHAEYTSKKALLKEICELSSKLREPFFMHMNETADEVAGCVARYGLRPFELMDELGAFEYGGGGFHCVHLSEHEMEIMAQKRVAAVTCPCSNLKLASGIAPVTELVEHGVEVAVGTDGAASNNALDMFREMYLVSVLQKLRLGADKIDGADVLTMASVNGAHVMGLNNSDAITVGKQADLVLIDLDRPNMQPILNIPKNIVYAGSRADVAMTMIAGKVIYERGEYFVGEAPELIYQKAQAAIDRMRA